MKLIFTLFLLLIGQISYTQNLIPNPGFEDVNVCEVFEERCSPRAWRNVVLKSFQFPQMAKYDKTSRGARVYEGFRSAVIPLYHKKRENDRTYIQVPFLCTLEKGKEYEFSFYYQVMEETTQSIGVIFTDSLFIRESMEDLMGRTPDVGIPLQENPKYNEWVEFKMNYTAKGGEQGIIVGNYMKDEDIEYKALVKLKKKEFYPKRLMIWLDGFNFSPLDSLDNPCDLEYNKQEIYYDTIRHYIKDLTMPRNISNPSIPKEEIKEEIKVEENPIHNHEEHTEIIEAEEEIVIEDIDDEKESKGNIILNESFTLEGIQFETNSETLLAYSYGVLDELLEYLLENETHHLTITGFTDNVGTVEKNLKLSKRRAGSIAAYLIRKGVLLTRISSFGKGEKNPIDSNKTKKGRAKNRRMEFLLKER